MRKRTTKILMNRGGLRKPVEQITDRAKRYRANRPGVRPNLPKKCAVCGSGKNVGVDHKDGDESNGRRSNLAWLCKRCNARKAVLQKAAGVGVRTRQFNPSRGARSRELAHYDALVKVMRGDLEGNSRKAHEAVLEADPELRSQYTSNSWAIRRQRYGKSGRREKLPF
jgi:hypothetical protein